MTDRAPMRPKPPMLRDIEPSGGIAERLAEIKRAEGRDEPPRAEPTSAASYLASQICRDDEAFFEVLKERIAAKVLRASMMSGIEEISISYEDLMRPRDGKVIQWPIEFCRTMAEAA